MPQNQQPPSQDSWAGYSNVPPPITPPAPPAQANPKGRRKPQERVRKLPRIGSLKSLDDALKLTEKTAKAFADGQISHEDVAANVNLAKTVVIIRKAQMFSGGAEDAEDTRTDFSDIQTNPDIEAARPAIVVAKDFAGMTPDERREFFASLRRKPDITEQAE